MSRQLYIKSIKLGSIHTLVACAIFVIIEELKATIEFGFGGKVDIEFSILLFVFGSLLALIPAAISSSFLAFLLYKGALVKRISILDAFQKGATFGAASGGTVCIVGIILTNGRGDEIVYLIQAIEVISLAIMAGGWTGIQLARQIINIQNSIST